MINVDFADVRTVMSEMGMAMMGSGSASGEDRAREAAESAIRSPLLEDIDFTGARGVLVNIAAGTDISLGEFSEVGQTVEEFASENATVVIGTVIDESMGDELRVTVVATGLGAHAQMERSLKMKDQVKEKVAGDGRPDYSHFERPTVIRNAVVNGTDEVDLQADKDLDYLDIPAFLRRQAD
jgi:cell division protein FtsZ